MKPYFLPALTILLASSAFAADSPPASAASSSSVLAIATPVPEESAVLPNDEDVIDPEAGMLGEDDLGEPPELED